MAFWGSTFLLALALRSCLFSSVFILLASHLPGLCSARPVTAVLSDPDSLTLGSALFTGALGVSLCCLLLQAGKCSLSITTCSSCPVPCGDKWRLGVWEPLSVLSHFLFSDELLSRQLKFHLSFWVVIIPHYFCLLPWAVFFLLSVFQTWLLQGVTGGSGDLHADSS